MGWEPPEESKSVELPPGHGDCPDGWFYVRHTSEHALLRSLADGFVTDVLWIECYRQAWIREKHRNG